MVSIKTTTEISNKKLKKEKIKKINTSLQKPKHIKDSEELSKETDNISKETYVRRRNPKYVVPSKYINENIVSSVLSCLETLTNHYTKKNAIFGDELAIFMEIRCIKIPNTTGSIKIVLPHSTVASSGEVCLITKDLKKGKKPDHEPTVDHWEELLRRENVTSIKTILPMRQLRVEYDQYELKRRLLTQHDFIMVDTRVLNHVSHELGKMFYKKHNMLIPIKINENGDLKKDIDVGLRTVMLRINEGQTCTVTVGHTAMPQNKLKENILALVKKLKDRYPGGEMNIRSLSIKLPLSASLPLYLTLRPCNSITAPRIKVNKPKDFVVYEGELSTKLGAIVTVAPDGTVHHKIKDETSMSDMEEDEELDLVSEDDKSGDD